MCDRGLLDGKAYAGDENWAKMLTQIKVKPPIFRSPNNKSCKDTRQLYTW